jgi:hypothetical protein
MENDEMYLQQTKASGFWTGIHLPLSNSVYINILKDISK